jgi:hypothetical protein
MGIQTTDEARWRRDLAAAHHRAANDGVVHCARPEGAALAHAQWVDDGHTTKGQDEWPALLRDLQATVQSLFLQESPHAHHPC